MTGCCAFCGGDFVVDDQRVDGIGWVHWGCPSCPESKGFAYHGGSLDLEAIREAEERVWPLGSFEIWR